MTRKNNKSLFNDQMTQKCLFSTKNNDTGCRNNKGHQGHFLQSLSACEKLLGTIQIFKIDVMLGNHDDEETHRQQ